MARVSLTDLVKRYPGARSDAVKGISFDIEDGELLVILGPSGCGKTSTLRMMAGLESVTSGDITFDGRSVRNVAPARRNVAMAFENYGLYEHWSVFDNIAYPLRLRGVAGAELSRTVREVAEKLQVSKHLDVRPTDLSGGTRQRIGLARALVRDPSVFLLDEPMSHVDADLRNDMRAEIKRIHLEVGSTMVIVTHDQLDALAMADRILVMNDGQIEQHDTPDAVYNHPATAFVAGFIGEPPMNMLTVTVEVNFLGLPDGTKVPVPEQYGHQTPPRGSALTLAFRPHDAALHAGPPLPTRGGLSVTGVVYMVEPLGDRTLVTVEGPGFTLMKADLTGPSPVRIGDPVWIAVRGDQVQLFDGATGRALPTGSLTSVR